MEHTPGIPKPPNERNSFINRWLGVWGMFQGYVGKFLESGYLRRLILYEGIPFHTLAKRVIGSACVLFLFPWIQSGRIGHKDFYLSTWTRGVSISWDALPLKMRVNTRIIQFLGSGIPRLTFSFRYHWEGFCISRGSSIAVSFTSEFWAFKPSKMVEKRSPKSL